MEKVIKQRWIRDITKTILMYRYYLRKGRKAQCPLCQHVRIAQGYVTCKTCIHTTKYSQGVACWQQQSFKRLPIIVDGTCALPTQPEIGLVKWRISYLLKVKKRLIADL